MASRRLAKIRAKRKARQVFRSNRRKPKRAVLKKFANFVGKVTYKAVKSKRRGRRMRRMRRRR